MTKQIQKLRRTVNYQRRYLLAMRHKAATCTNSKRWSMYMHKCKAIKKELRLNCEALRTLLKLNKKIKGTEITFSPHLADAVIQDKHNPIKHHLFRHTVNGLSYNQAINGTLQYSWQACHSNHGYRHLFDNR